MDCKVFDGAAVVHMLPTKLASTFTEYADKVFLSWMKQQLTNSRRKDIIWDQYIADSLKETTREKRGKGIRKKVKRQTKLPIDFQKFLKDPIKLNFLNF